MIKRWWIIGSALSIGMIIFWRYVSDKEPKDAPSLGRLLFFDPILSADSTISCASCHKPNFAFADTSALSIGVLAAFERSQETINTPFDEWCRTGRESTISASAKKGYALFNGKGRCISCHFGTNFTTGDFRNIGLYDGVQLVDSGRAAITGNRADLGKFKVASLRNIALTAPYMHNGMFRTLREVIDYYDDPDKVVPHAQNRDPLLATPLHLSNEEKQELEDFLRSLTDRVL